MNHHPSAMPPYGQMPMPLPQRRHEMSYSPMPPNLRPQPSYQGYYHPHMNGPMPQYAPQYAPQWYPYQHMHHQPPPPRAYPSYPQHQVQSAHSHSPMMIPPYALHQPPHTPANAAVMQHQQPSVSPSHSQFTPQTNASTSTPLRSPFSPPPSSTPSTANAQPETPPSTSSMVSQSASEMSNSPQDPFFPPLPWSSVGDLPFPNKARRQRRRIMRSQLGTAPVNYPLEETPAVVESSSIAEEPEQPLEKDEEDEDVVQEEIFPVAEERQETPKELASIISPPVQTPTTQTSEAPSETGSTDLTTPSPACTPQPVKSQPMTDPQMRSNRTVVPVVPAVPIMPLSPKTSRHAHRDSVSVVSSNAQTPQFESSSQEARRSSSTSVPAVSEISPVTSVETSKPASPPAPPKSWADLVRSKVAPKAATNSAVSQIANGLGPAKTETLSDVLNAIDVTSTQNASKIAFLKPRGLVNTGNMCYMNSVLQILVFCIPFYEFLERVGQRSAHTFKSDTPLINAMILFMREFSVIDSADSFEQLRLRLKPDELELYGDSFIPEYVYQVIRQLPRFRDMRRGHQQDAQEFLGFLLEELHEECAQAMRGGSSVNSGTSTPTEKSSSIAESADQDAGWMEVGHKQKPAITRSSGAITTESPVTKIFGGKLRSEWKVPGNKNSVTLEPYQPLQLDIGAPQVNNIIDALKGLTRPESMQGDFNSSRGSKVTATKQVFIETLPPVLILHLKRFQYDNATKRTEKIWKKVGYPLELEMPREVFPPQVRNKLAVHGGIPKYQLIGVIYHHGKNAGGGHYTVDVRRQDGREWIRLDDTLIRRVRNEDVAEGGSEEDPQVLAAALERHHQRTSVGGGGGGGGQPQGNMFEQIEDEDAEAQKEDEMREWSQVNGHGHGHAKNRSSMPGAGLAVNGGAGRGGGEATPMSKSGAHTPRHRYEAKDNKVAYLLFYRRVASSSSSAS